MALILETRVETDKAKRELKKLAASGERDIKKLESKSVSSSNKMSSAFSGISKGIVAVGAAFVAAGIGQKIIGLASDAEESQSRFDVVFKGIEKDAATAFEMLGEKVGRSRLELIQFAGGLGDVLKPLGFTTKEALGLSRQMTELAIDVASFTNKSDADVLHAFTAALTGETEALKTYGIVLNQNMIQNEAYKAGLAKTGEQLTQTEKALAVVNLLFKNTKDAQGDATRTSDSFANQLKRLTGNLTDLGVKIGAYVLPPLNFILHSINSIFAALEGKKSLVDVIWNVWQPIRDIQAKIAGTAVDVKKVQKEQVDISDEQKKKYEEINKLIQDGLASARQHAIVDRDHVSQVKERLKAEEKLYKLREVSLTIFKSFSENVARDWNLIRDSFVKVNTELSTGIQPAAIKVGEEIKGMAVNAYDIGEIIGSRLVGSMDNFIDRAIGAQNVLEHILADLFKFFARLALFKIISQAIPGSSSFASQLLGFQHGGSFTVGGSGGADSQVVAFRASPGEKVTVTPPGQTVNNKSMSIGTVVINSTASPRQLAKELLPMLNDLAKQGRLEVVSNRVVSRGGR